MWFVWSDKRVNRYVFPTVGQQRKLTRTVRVFLGSLVSFSFSPNTKMCSGTTDCNGLSFTYSYVHPGTRMTVSFMFCALVASYGVRMVVQSLSTTRANLPSP